ncbi:MAG: response regulator [Ignavibacteriae bacterium]|nr:MAG: response regulator [Ignavibacteriota bacterium]
MKKLLVALVDDDRIYQFTTERMLQRLGVEIGFLWFKDGEEALGYIEEHREQPDELPDVLIVDINMPYMDGWQFLDAFRAVRATLSKNIDIYMVSSSNDDRDVKRALTTEGVCDYVEKPITREKLTLILAHRM